MINYAISGLFQTSMMDIFLRKLLNAFSRELSLQKTFIIGVFQGPKYATAPCVCV